MADRFAVATGNWDASNTAIWAATDGGAPGASVPTSADNVFFTAASGGITVTKSASSACANLDFTGFTGTFAGSQPLQVFGNLTLNNVMTFTFGGILSFSATTTGKTINFGGRASIGTNTQFNGTGGGWTLLSNVAFTNSFTHTAGAIDLGVFTFSIDMQSWGSTGSIVRSLTGSAGSKIICGNINITGSNVTYSTSNVDLQASGATITLASTTWRNITLTNPTTTVLSACTGSTLTVTGGASASARLSLSGNVTSTGLLTLNGNSASFPLFVGSNDDYTVRTLSAGSLSVVNSFFENITAAGAASWNFSAQTDIGDCGRNTGITFPAPVTCYWNGGTANWNASNRWYTATGGGGVAARIPLPQDIARFDANSFSSSGQTVTLNLSYFSTLDFTGVTNNPIFSAATTIKFYGSLTQASGMSWTGAGVFTFYGHSTHTITSAGVTHARNFSFAGPSGTYTLSDALTLGSANIITFAAGTFSDGGYTVTYGRMSNSGSNTRVQNLSGSHYMGANNNTMIDCAVTTGLTFNATTASFYFTYSGATGTRTMWAGTTSLGMGKVYVTAGSDTVSFGSYSAIYRGIDFTGFTGTIAGNTAQNIWGDYIIGNIAAYTSNAGLAFNNSSGSYVINTNNKSFGSGGIAVSGANAITLIGNLTITGAFSLTAGTFDKSGYNMTVSNFVITGSTARSFICGNGTVTITGTGTVFNANTTTNLTWSQGTTTFVMNNASASIKQFASGGLAIYGITCQGTGTGIFQIMDGPTVTVFTVLNAPKTVDFEGSNTFTFTTFTATGSSGNLITLRSTTGSAYNFIKSGIGIVSCDYLSIANSAASPADTWYAGLNSTNAGGNTGWIFTGPPVTGGSGGLLLLRVE